MLKALKIAADRRAITADPAFFRMVDAIPAKILRSPGNFFVLAIPSGWPKYLAAAL